MADFKIKPSAGTGNKLLVQSQDQSGSSYAIQVGDAGATTLTNATLTTATMTAGTIGTGVTKKIHGFSAYNSADDCSIPNATWTEASAVGTWVENFDSLGHYASGRFTPTIQGVYLIGYTAVFAPLDSEERFISAIRRNGLDTASNIYAFNQQYAHASSNYMQAMSGSAIIQLDTNDYVSLWVEHNEGSTGNLAINTTQFWGTYIGTV